MLSLPIRTSPYGKGFTYLEFVIFKVRTKGRTPPFKNMHRPLHDQGRVGSSMSESTKFLVTFIVDKYV